MNTTDLPAAIQADTRAAIDDLTGGGLRPASMAACETVCVRLAHYAYTAGRAAAIPELLTTDQAAADLGITVGRVRQIAPLLGVGWKLGPGTWLFRPEDIATMRARVTRAGRPKRA